MSILIAVVLGVAVLFEGEFTAGQRAAVAGVMLLAILIGLFLLRKAIRGLRAKPE